MLKTIALIVVVAVAALLANAGTRPDTFALQRSVLIAAPPDKIYPLIADLRAFNQWNPFEKKDPNAKGNYSGPSGGPGAVYRFEGKDVGTGSLQVTGATPAREVLMQLDMVKPLEGHNQIRFSLLPQGTGTEVTWAMQGASPFVAKLAGIFFNMDKMIGADFESGLANLKALAERP